MRRHLDKDLVALVALVAAVAWGTWLFARAELELDAAWTDGRTRYESTEGARIRHAIWDDARLLGGAVNSEGREARPALSPDGRLLVFTVGERGLGADLWVAEVLGGDPLAGALGEPRPLARVNSAADDLAPAFGADGLYFASDRGGAAYGLDLWRAPYVDGVLGEPESVGTGLHTAGHETEPFPLADGSLLFASDRPRGARTDYDLYLARPTLVDGERRFEVEALETLNTPFDERDPALSADGRTLYFASQRLGGAGGFDLWRSFDEGAGWLPPRPLVGVNTAGDERGPLPSPDGFALLFDATDATEATAVAGAEPLAPDLWGARSRELFRVPREPLGLGELLILAVLLLLALLAVLAKRWRGIAVLYRCLLASLVVHLLFLWLLRDVTPETPPTLTAPGDAVYRVRLASAAPGKDASLSERGGQLEVERERAAAGETTPDRSTSEAVAEALEASAAASGQPGRRAVDASERGSDAAPERAADTVAAPGAELAARTDTHGPSEQLARHGGARPGLEVAAADLGGARVEVVTASAPGRATAATVVASGGGGAVRPDLVGATAGLLAPRAAADDPSGTGVERGHLDPDQLGGAPEVVTSVAAPSERLARGAGGAPGLELTEARSFAVGERSATDDGGPARADMGAGLAQALAGTELPTPGAGGPVEAAERGSDEQDAAAPERRAGNGPSLGQGVEVAVGLRPPSEAEGTTGAAAGAAASPELGLGEALAFAAPERAVRGPDRRPGPERAGASSSTPAGPTTLGGLSTAERETAPVPAGPTRLGGTASSGLAAPVGPDLRDALAEATGEPGASDRAAPGFDATAGLAAVTAPSRSTTAATAGFGPQRLAADAPGLADAAPAVLALATAPEPEPAADTGLGRSALASTPYKNRFGAEKLRALEEFGGSVETEAAVAAGLGYLARVQREDGSWGRFEDADADKYGDVRVGKTALCLLAFLGAGHDPDSGREHADVAARAVDFLLAQQLAGGRGVLADGRRNWERRRVRLVDGHIGAGSAYSHGIATYALAECFALTGDERLRVPLERAVQRILDAQVSSNDDRRDGGWGYFFGDDHVWQNDRWPRASVTAWQVMALESARLGGLSVPAEAFADAGRFLAGTWDSRRGAFRYSHDPGRLSSGYPILPASTPAAMFALSLLGVDLASDDLAGPRAYVLERLPGAYRRPADDAFVFRAEGNLYFWYYGTLAMFRAGGSDWRRWNLAMQETLLPSQRDDGSWRPISLYASYAGDSRDSGGDRSYTTAMNVLTLEVYYRYFTPLLEVR